MRVYPDSCVVIYVVEECLPMVHAIRERLLPEGPLPQVVISDLTRLECRVWPMRHGKAALLTDFDGFFTTPGFRHAQMGRDTFDLATELRAEHGLKTPDALHLAAAIMGGCDEFWTNDERLAKAAEDRLRIVVFE
jgi:uncharacterized protein